ncbi:F-box protein PP2-B11-like [Carex rostrata]
MVLARALEIEHSDDGNKWMWVPQQDSRFEEVVGLLKVHWLEIQETISFIRITAETTYAAYLIFKTTPNSICLDTLQEASVSVGDLQLKKDVCIKPRVPNPRNKCNAFPINRSDGWMELELGQFYCDGHGGEVVVSLRDINIKNEKNGLIVAAIEVRPI